MPVGAPHAGIDHVIDAAVGVPAYVHAYAEENIDNAGVLADRPVPLGTHARVDQDLRHGVTRGRGLLALVRRMHRPDKVRRVIVGDILQGIADAVDEILLADRAHVPGREPRWVTSVPIVAVSPW